MPLRRLALALYAENPLQTIYVNFPAEQTVIANSIYYLFSENNIGLIITLNFCVL